MPLINRVSRLFRSDMHAVLDRIEEPVVLFRQALREMEEDVTRDEQRQKQLKCELSGCSTRIEELDNSHKQIDEELDLCFASNKQDLARAMVKRKLESERLLKVLHKRRKQIQGEQDDLDARLGQNRSRLAAMQQKLEIMVEAESHSIDEHTRPDLCFEDNLSVSDEEVEVAMLKEQQKRAAS